jgi:hypothetical protein
MVAGAFEMSDGRGLSLEFLHVIFTELAQAGGVGFEDYFRAEDLGNG